ncbi:proton-conducting membrane transporter [Serinibacter arcticus]|uniref:Proton-conducting membrane transporter n=1 Tax=Serinibacter arcticus TaxID=1655435 RepID=A0A2U1ZZT1_9MICO|nr:proton-conducting transporter membrane subunit [Serinibacter arcticus]PWD52422.1 proton-conducting membrane transporter [Serinibacter arcticus]
MNPDATVTTSAIPYLVLLASLLPALVIFSLRESQVRTRTAINLGAALVKLALVISLIPPVVAGEKQRAAFEWVPGLDIVLVTDSFGLFFGALSAALWLVTTIYAIGYLEGSPNRSRFFGFFSLCVTATAGIGLAGNLLTFLIFFEMLTLVTYPLVAHRGTSGAFAGARTYLTYTLTGGVVLLAGIVWLTAEVGPVEFTSGGVEAVAQLARDEPVTATAIATMMLIGVAVKAAIFPLHGWLPAAMVAPAPVSALLHAVAVVKAGAFGIVRVVHDVFGAALLAQLGVLTVLAVMAAFTIVYGSVRALAQDDLKKRLAYSTVSQLSYVALGAALLSPLALAGALVHIVNQGVMKITLFFCAGLFAEELKVSRVSELAGVGRRLPLAGAAFTVAALGMMGLPPLAGFVSKWALGTGALDAGDAWVVPVLLTSTVLNAGYFLPVVYRLWALPPDADAAWADERPRRGAPLALLAPPVVTAVLTVVLGVTAGLSYSPWSLAQIIAGQAFP